MRDCLNCEKPFEHHINSPLIEPEYCSVECQEIFKAILQAEISDSQAAGLIDMNGTALLSARDTIGSLTPAKAAQIIENFKIKMVNKDED